MRTETILNEELIKEAFKYSSKELSEKELIEQALMEYINVRKRKNLKDLKGKIEFSDNYDYKTQNADVVLSLRETPSISQNVNEFLEKWSGILSDNNINDKKYEYLMEKHK